MAQGLFVCRVDLLLASLFQQLFFFRHPLPCQTSNRSRRGSLC